MEISISSIFFDEYHRLSSPDELATAIQGENGEWVGEYFQKIPIFLFEVDELKREIDLILSKISPQKFGLFTKSLSIEELILMLKLYLISWSTMKDVMAKLISETLDLGIADQDLSFGSILRNNKVRRTQIPIICTKYNKIIDMNNTDTARNEVAHRGKLLDDEVISLRQTRWKIESRKFSLLLNESDRLSDEEYDAQIEEYYQQENKLVEKKRKQYEKHFSKTLKLTAEITIELASIYHKSLCGLRI